MSETTVAPAFEQATVYLLALMFVHLAMPAPEGHDCPTCGHYHYPEDDDVPEL